MEEKSILQGAPATLSYTVVGQYVDNDQIWVEWVEAATYDNDQIARIAIRKMANDCGADIDNMTIVAIFNGHMMERSQYPSPKPAWELMQE